MKIFFIIIMEQPVKTASCGTRQLEIRPCHFMLLKSVITSNFALLFSAPSVAVSAGLITAAAAVYARRLYIDGRPQTITKVIEDLGWHCHGFEQQELMTNL